MASGTLSSPCTNRVPNRVRGVRVTRRMRHKIIGVRCSRRRKESERARRTRAFLAQKV